MKKNLLLIFSVIHDRAKATVLHVLFFHCPFGEKGIVEHGILDPGCVTKENQRGNRFSAETGTALLSTCCLVCPHTPVSEPHGTFCLVCPHTPVSEPHGT